MPTDNQDTNRVSIFLPLTFQTMGYVNPYVTKIRDKCGGVTWSQVATPAPVKGWGKNLQGEWDEDDVCHIIVDIDPAYLKETSGQDILDWVTDLFAEMSKEFAPQEIWMILHPVRVIKKAPLP